MTEDTSYSDFMADEPVAVSHAYTGFAKLADGAYCTLWRACKNSLWVVVKSLQPQSRGVCTAIDPRFHINRLFRCFTLRDG